MYLPSLLHVVLVGDNSQKWWIVASCISTGERMEETRCCERRLHHGRWMARHGETVEPSPTLLIDRNQCVNLRQPWMNRSRSHHSTPISDDGQSIPMISVICRVPSNIMVSAMQIIPKHSIVWYPTQDSIDHGWSRKSVKIRRKSIANSPPIADRQQPLYRRRLASRSDSSRHRMSSSRTTGRGIRSVCFTLLLRLISSSL